MDGSVVPLHAVSVSSLTDNNLYLDQLFDSLAEQAIEICPKFSGAAIILKVPGTQVFEGVGGAGTFDSAAVRSKMRYNDDENYMLSIATRIMGDTNTYWIPDVPSWLVKQSATAFQNVYDLDGTPSQLLAVSLWRKDADLKDVERIGLLVYNDWIGGGSPIEWNRQNLATLELLRNKIAYFAERLLDNREQLLADLASGAVLDSILTPSLPETVANNNQLLGIEGGQMLLAALSAAVLGVMLLFVRQVAVRDLIRGLFVFLSSAITIFLFSVGFTERRAVLRTASLFAACILFYEIVITLRLLASR